MRRFLPVAVLLVALAACGEPSPTVPEPTAAVTTTITQPSSPSPDATASAPASPSPGSTGDPTKLTSPEESSAHLFDAWKRGDRAGALRFADQDAVDELFSRPYTGPDPEFMGCDHEVDHFFCRYRYEGGSMTFRVDGGVSAGYFVTEVTSRAD